MGVVSQAGQVAYDPQSESYTLTASGANIWGERDDFLLVSKEHSGDVSFSAEVNFLGEGADPHRKARLMIRQSLDAASPYIDVMVHDDGLTSLQYREIPGGETKELAEMCQFRPL